MSTSSDRNFDLAVIRRQQALKDFNRRGLAGAIGPKQPEALTASNCQIESVDRDDGAVTFDDTDAAERYRLRRHHSIVSRGTLNVLCRRVSS